MSKKPRQTHTDLIETSLRSRLSPLASAEPARERAGLVTRPPPLRPVLARRPAPG